MSPNVAAFLTMISHAEGTDRPPAPPDPYRTCYGYKHVILSLAEHPAVSGEWQGESLDSLGPRYTGMVSTAAGRYQILRNTWRECKRVMELLDFTGPSQDIAAIYLIQKVGALPFVTGGDIPRAIKACNGIWASLPGSTARQPQRTLADLLTVYSGAGGALA